MQFEWDAGKARANEAKHGVPFEFATRVFDDPFHIAKADSRRDYGEMRNIALGMIEGRLYVVAYTLRRDAVRIIPIATEKLGWVSNPGAESAGFAPRSGRDARQEFQFLTCKRYITARKGNRREKKIYDRSLSA